ncbi:MAG: cysteine dioxygenase family protein [Bacteroidota bacterium]
MSKIESIEELIQELDAHHPEAFVKIAKRMRIPLCEYEPYALWKPGGYTRNCIERTAKYELLLLCWAPGSETAIHGHNEQRCWVHQVEGSLLETRYRMLDDERLVKDHTVQLTPGKLSFMMDEMGFHTLKNPTDEGAMSLHLYISPIDVCDSYDPHSKEFLSKPLEYDSFKGVIKEVYNSL